jgi:3-hydroxymyristoyl/3-hydroxydecanoyl-(acyl carrier protein) dehydratase
MKFDRAAVLATLPQQPPFLFVDEAEIEGDLVRATYAVRGDESCLEGHFKGNPVFPASIVFEALGQAACLWVLKEGAARLGMPVASGEVFFASMDGAHFYRVIKPGDVLEMEQKLRRLRAPVAVFQGSVKVGGERACQVDQLMLAFGDKIKPPGA